MKSLLFLAALTIVANSANALPVWARLVARSHCEYLEMGATLEPSLTQAMRDNDIWRPEMKLVNENAGLATKAIFKAIDSFYFDLQQDALKNYVEMQNKGLELSEKEVFPKLPPLR